MVKAEPADSNALRREYDILLAGCTSAEVDPIYMRAAIEHILKRLGPPDPAPGTADQFKAEDWA